MGEKWKDREFERGRKAIEGRVKGRKRVEKELIRKKKEKERKNRESQKVRN
jgi:hypothetical protein